MTPTMIRTGALYYGMMIEYKGTLYKLVMFLGYEQKHDVWLAVNHENPKGDTYLLLNREAYWKTIVPPAIEYFKDLYPNEEL